MRIALAIASVLLAAAPAAGQGRDELAEARRLEAALDYDGALTIVHRVIAHGGADRGRIVELHLLAGRLAAGLDRLTVAEDHFARALALRPEATLPDGTSPKITAPFAIARARAVTLQVRVTAVKGLVTLVTDADALGLVAGIQVAVVDASGKHVDVVERHSTRLAIPAGTTAIEVAALDDSGNRIWLGTLPADPAETVIRTDGPPLVRPRSWIARWPTWTAITAVALGTGSFAAWRFNVAQHDWDRLRDEGTHDFTDLRAVEARGRRWGATATIALGVGAATGIASVILYLRGDPRDQREPRISVGAGPGLGLAVNATF